MILRDPEFSDYTWIPECYADWPMDDVCTEHKAVEWLKRWKVRGDIQCRVLQDADPIGLITFRHPYGFAVTVENLVIRPQYRGHGASTKLIRMLRDELRAQGVVVAEFQTLPGVIRDQLGSRYQDLGDNRGRLTWDMDDF